MNYIFIIHYRLCEWCCMYVNCIGILLCVIRVHFELYKIKRLACKINKIVFFFIDHLLFLCLYFRYNGFVWVRSLDGICFCYIHIEYTSHIRVVFLDLKDVALVILEVTITYDTSWVLFPVLNAHIFIKQTPMGMYAKNM